MPVLAGKVLGGEVVTSCSQEIIISEKIAKGNNMNLCIFINSPALPFEI
jgi:hypothetical protein